MVTQVWNKTLESSKQAEDKIRDVISQKLEEVNLTLKKVTGSLLGIEFAFSLWLSRQMAVVLNCAWLYPFKIYRYIYFFFLGGGEGYIAFNTVQVISRRVVGRAEETSTYSLSGVLYCKLPTNGKQLPAFPLEAVPGTEPQPQRWEGRVLPLCHRGFF